MDDESRELLKELESAMDEISKDQSIPYSIEYWMENALILLNQLVQKVDRISQSSPNGQDTKEKEAL
jgi:hypothetical protein